MPWILCFLLFANGFEIQVERDSGLTAQAADASEEGTDAARPVFGFAMVMDTENALTSVETAHNPIKRLLDGINACPFVHGEDGAPLVQVLLFHTGKSARDLPIHIIPPELKQNVVFINVTKWWLPNYKKGKTIYRSWPMNDFWSHKIFNISEVASLQYLARIEAGSRFKCDQFSDNFFAEMRDQKQVYGYFKFLRILTDQSNGNVYNDLIRSYIQVHNVPQPNMGVDLSSMGDLATPAFFPTFEVMNIPFFRQRKVKEFVKSMYLSEFSKGNEYTNGMERFFQVFLHASDLSQLRCFGKEIHYAYGSNHAGNPGLCHIPSGEQLRNMTTMDQFEQHHSGHHGGHGGGHFESSRKPVSWRKAAGH